MFKFILESPEKQFVPSTNDHKKSSRLFMCIMCFSFIFLRVSYNVLFQIFLKMMKKLAPDWTALMFIVKSSIDEAWAQGPSLLIIDSSEKHTNASEETFFQWFDHQSMELYKWNTRTNVLGNKQQFVLIITRFSVWIVQETR